MTGLDTHAPNRAAGQAPPAHAGTEARTLLLVAAGMAAPIGLLALAPHAALSRPLAHFALLHAFAEGFVVVAAAAIFGIGWLTAARESSGSSLVLACGCLAVSLLEFAHLLASPAGAAPPGTADPSRAFYFWIAARLALSGSLAAMMLPPGRRPGVRLSRFLLPVLAVGLAAGAYWLTGAASGAPPLPTIDAASSTARVGIELAALCVNLAVLYALVTRRPGAWPLDTAALLGALLALSMGQTASLLRPVPAGPLDLLAHAYTVLGFALLYRAMHSEVVVAPYRRLDALARRVVDLQEQERRHIARELHDQIGQQLTGLKIMLDVAGVKGRPAGGEPADPRQAEARRVVGELIGRVRDLSMDLRPAMLDDLGLVPALEWHVERFAGHTGVRVEFSQTLRGARFPQPVETAAFRIVQEALTNVARHARVDHARVHLGRERGALVLRVEDEGAGMDAATAAAARSTGISGMRERARLLGGSLTVDSTPDGGTRLRAELPGQGPVEASE
jgi:signal transduction histidine kinase